MGIASQGAPYGKVTSENFEQPGIIDYRYSAIGVVALFGTVYLVIKTFEFIQAFSLAIDTVRYAMKKTETRRLSFWSLRV